MTTVTTPGGSSAGDQQPFLHQRRLMGWWPSAALILVLLSSPVAVTAKIPYYAISPGAAVSVEPLVHVKDGPSFDPKGQIFLTTVGLKRTTIVEALQGWL